MEIPLNIDWQQILLHLFNFAILTGGLYFLLYSPIKKFIAKREDYYRNLDSEAKERMDSACELEAKARARLENVEAEIKEKRIKAEADLEQYIASQMQESNAKADRIIADARHIAEEEKKSILDSADKEIVDMAKSATAKIIHPSTDEAYRQFLDIAERDA